MDVSRKINLLMVCLRSKEKSTVFGKESIRMGKYRWINSDVEIDFPIDDIVLKNTIEDCEQFDLAGDYQYFGMARAIDVLCKALFTGGHMTQYQWDKLVERYPE